MHVVIRRWAWLECIGVVSGCCKEVRIYHKFPHMTYSYSMHLYQLFFTAASLLLFNLFILKMFFHSCLCYFVQYSKSCSKNIRDRSEIEITPTWHYNYIDKHDRFCPCPLSTIVIHTSVIHTLN